MHTGRAANAETRLFLIYSSARIRSAVNLRYLPDSRNASSISAAFASLSPVLYLLNFAVNTSWESVSGLNCQRRLVEILFLRTDEITRCRIGLND